MVRFRTHCILLALPILCVSYSATARAQSEPTDTEMATARTLFREGVAHTQSDEWNEARDAFERSYRVAAVPVTLLNLASAQAHTGQLVAALESYRGFLSAAGDSPRARPFREQAAAAIAELERRIGHLRMSSGWLTEADRLLLNGVAQSHAIVGTDVPVDPGEVEVSVVRDGSTVARESITVAEGQHASVALQEQAPAISPADVAAAEAARQAEAEAATERTRSHDHSVLRSPWLWAGVGAVVVGVVVAGVVVASSGSPNPYQGSVGTGTLGFE